MPPVRILRERHRRPWQRGRVLAAVAVLALLLGLVGAAWRLGGPVPMHGVTVSLPEVEVGAASQPDAPAPANGSAPR